MKMHAALLSLTLLMGISFAAEVKEVSFSCNAKDCSLRFQFASEKNLPSFFQKYDAKTQKLVVGFSETVLSLGEGSFALDALSPSIRHVRTYQDVSKKTNLLKFEFSVGESIKGDKNPVSLASNREFVLLLPKSKALAWKLSKVVLAQEKVAQQKMTAEEKKAKNLQEKNAVAEKEKAKALQVAEEKQQAAQKAQAEKDRKALEKKLADDKIQAEKKRVAEEKALAVEKAQVEKERKALEKKLADDKIQADKKRIAEEKKVAEAKGEKKKVSALIDGIQEMSDLCGNGLEQFRLVTDAPIELNKVVPPDKASTIIVSIPGPEKSPVFKVNSGSMVKSLTWGATGLRIQLYPGVRPIVVIYEGSLILQMPEQKSSSGIGYWIARPQGIETRSWKNVPLESIDSFDSFTTNLQQDSKKIVSMAQAFQLRPVPKDLIVVAEETDFYTNASEKSQVLQRLFFGERLANMELTGLFYKVRLGGKVGFVNKRAVSFRDELSAVQSERLKQISLEKGEKLDSTGIHFETVLEDRVSYSSFGRRDPFVEIKGLVEEGINIDQVELVGIIFESEVPMAILADSKNPSISYTVKEGDKILNGKVLKITQTDVLFLLQEFGVSRRYSMGLPDKYGGKK